MARIKSLLIGVQVDQAKKSHNCQANSAHRIQGGDTRLKVRNGRSWDHYCVSCARTIIERDILELQKLRGNFPTS